MIHFAYKFNEKDSIRWIGKPAKTCLHQNQDCTSINTRRGKETERENKEQKKEEGEEDSG